MLVVCGVYESMVEQDLKGHQGEDGAWTFDSPSEQVATEVLPHERGEVQWRTLSVGSGFHDRRIANKWVYLPQTGRTPTSSVGGSSAAVLVPLLVPAEVKRPPEFRINFSQGFKAPNPQSLNHQGVTDSPVYRLARLAANLGSGSPQHPFGKHRWVSRFPG